MIPITKVNGIYKPTNRTFGGPHIVDIVYCIAMIIRLYPHFRWLNTINISILNVNFPIIVVYFPIKNHIHRDFLIYIYISHCTTLWGTTLYHDPPQALASYRNCHVTGSRELRAVQLAVPRNEIWDGPRGEKKMLISPSKREI